MPDNLYKPISYCNNVFLENFNSRFIIDLLLFITTIYYQIKQLACALNYFILLQVNRISFKRTKIS